MIAVLGPNAVGSPTLTKFLREQKIRELARSTRFGTSTVWRHLRKSLGFTVKRVRCVPHTRACPAALRVVLSRCPLMQLRRPEWGASQYGVALDESWFLPQ
jgi:hypothetical protein